MGAGSFSTAWLKRKDLDNKNPKRLNEGREGLAQLPLKGAALTCGMDMSTQSGRCSGPPVGGFARVGSIF